MAEIVCIDGYQNTGKTLLAHTLRNAINDRGYTTQLVKPMDDAQYRLPPLDYYLSNLPVDLSEVDYVILDTSWLQEHYHRTHRLNTDPVGMRQLVDFYDQLVSQDVTRISYMLLTRPWVNCVTDHQVDEITGDGYGDTVHRFFENDTYTDYLTRSQFSELARFIYPDLTPTYLIKNTSTPEGLNQCLNPILY